MDRDGTSLFFLVLPEQYFLLMKRNVAIRKPNIEKTNNEAQNCHVLVRQHYSGSSGHRTRL